MEIDTGLVALKHHSYLISEALLEIEEICWNKSSAWFRVVRGLENIRYDRSTYDHQFGWCRGADEYELAKEQLHESILQEIVTFNLIWSGLECFIDELRLQKCPYEAGTINKTCYYLKTTYDPFQPIWPLEDLFSRASKITS